MSVTWSITLKNKYAKLVAYINLEKHWGMLARNGKYYHVGLQGTENAIDYAIEIEKMKLIEVKKYDENFYPYDL